VDARAVRTRKALSTVRTWLYGQLGITAPRMAEVTGVSLGLGKMALVVVMWEDEGHDRFVYCGGRLTGWMESEGLPMGRH
jgi:hypothetical protein